MNDRDQRRYDRATNVQTFGRVNTADFAAGGRPKLCSPASTSSSSGWTPPRPARTPTE